MLALVNSLTRYSHAPHSVQLMQAVYRAAQADPQCRDLTVEDPGEAFDTMRTLAELQMCMQQDIFVQAAVTLGLPTEHDGISFPKFCKEIGEFVEQKLKIYKVIHASLILSSAKHLSFSIRSEARSSVLRGLETESPQNG